MTNKKTITNHETKCCGQCIPLMSPGLGDRDLKRDPAVWLQNTSVGGIWQRYGAASLDRLKSCVSPAWGQSAHSQRWRINCCFITRNTLSLGSCPGLNAAETLLISTIFTLLRKNAFQHVPARGQGFLAMGRPVPAQGTRVSQVGSSVGQELDEKGMETWFPP